MRGEFLTSAGVWHLIAAIAVVTAIWMAVVGLSFDWTSAVLPGLACLGLCAVAAFYRYVRPDERLATSMTSVAQLVAFTAAAGPLSYAVASTGGPFWDRALLSWDRMLGLDWSAYLALVDARPRLGLAFTLAYQSIMPQMVVAVIVLGFSGRLVACRTFVLAAILAGLASIVISALMPAMAMFVHLGLRPSAYPNLDPAAAFVHVADLNGLRDGTLRIVNLDRLQGIITFPSYHAALAVIFAWAFWQSPWTRWPGLGLNLAMIAATPIDGGHYFVDVIAGCGIAAVSIATAERLCSRRAADPHPAATPAGA